ncbi:hypothetical protein EXE41_07030 [Halorubrum sp. SD690R]|uniref:Uncharacterized protein n=1 Tax=Halorubrum ezzemoulense TaxID=337243 RepID=A0A256JGZ1_HALEZ|nr:MULTISPECIES: hypothetical protein [Halorubrum]MDB9280367.1 hypothetical protein [Halorubrum ezzemoulense]MDB9284026.1 hypothetical protein [Halorubrum ezzemoulense]OYR68031.1 hypothetical protein DJ79_07515 [Halorubrum ezzemoulense]TKX47117.1 hypothetical protein EXE41_07030 [Halorubrum sp. SD690R]TKX66681.1 hypothetical protein EXE47_02200 [Halorubrum sp. GN12_10-3_MGM]
MVSTTAVKRALAALATRTDTARRPYVAVIDEADAARSDLRRAAGFVDAIGLDGLAEAIDAADRADDDAAVERGRGALAAYRSFRRAAAGDAPGNDREANAGSDADRDSIGDRAGGAERDHFRSGPGIPKPDTGQDADR